MVPDGLVQAVRVPAGRWTLTFVYRPAGLDAGLAGSALGLAALAAGRRRGRPPPASVAAGGATPAAAPVGFGT